MSYISVGMRTGIAELVLLPLTAPLSVGICYGYIPLCGHIVNTWYTKVYSLLLSCWMPLLITSLLCRQIYTGAGELWARGFRRLIEGRTAVLFIGTTMIFFTLRTVQHGLQPSTLFRVVRPLVANTRWQSFVLSSLQEIHAHLSYAAVFAVTVLFTAAVVPWVAFLAKHFLDHRYQSKLKEILD